jgi:hypothetical protein
LGDILTAHECLNEQGWDEVRKLRKLELCPDGVDSRRKDERTR